MFAKMQKINNLTSILHLSNESRYMDDKKYRSTLIVNIYIGAEHSELCDK